MCRWLERRHQPWTKASTATAKVSRPARKQFGKSAFREHVGHFWVVLETRATCARHGLAQALWLKGLRDQAVPHYHEMLRLNPGGNQGIRYLLIDCLRVRGRDDDVAKLIKR